MNEDTALRQKAHDELENLLNALLEKHNPATEGIIDVKVVLTTVTGNDADETEIYHNYIYSVELIAEHPKETWEVEEAHVKLEEFDNSGKRITEKWDSLGNL